MRNIKVILQSFLKVGLIGFGGGSALIPIIEKEMVEERKLLDKKTYLMHTICANVTPGALPVKLGAASGEYLGGNMGMLVGAYAVAFPGVLFTVLLLSLISKIDQRIIGYIEYASIGVTCFIIYLLCHYISKVFKSSRQNHFQNSALLICGASAFFTFGKEIRRLVFFFLPTLPEQFLVPIFDISTIDLLLITFFLIAGLGNKIYNARSIFSFITAIVYVLVVADYNFISFFPTMYIQLYILILSIIFILRELRMTKSCSASRRVNLRIPMKQSLLFILPILILYVISAIFLDFPKDYFLKGYVLNGVLSTITSFGGGEAYLTIADGIFVEGGIVPANVFYGQIIPIANALPGPILVKILSGIGYYIGNIKLGLFGGYLVATLGFSIAVGSTVIVFAFLNEIFNCYSELNFFKRLSIGILPVICGLLLTTMVAMFNESLKIISHVNSNISIAMILILVLFSILYGLLKTKKIHDVVVLLVLATTSLSMLILIA